MRDIFGEASEVHRSCCTLPGSVQKVHRELGADHGVQTNVFVLAEGSYPTPERYCFFG
jgi:hypothetical protein